MYNGHSNPAVTNSTFSGNMAESGGGMYKWRSSPTAPNISREWKRICKQAGGEDVTIHDLRRTYVTRLLRAGVPLGAVRRLAGHGAAGTTLKHYSGVTGDDLREGVAKIRDVAGS